MHPDKVIVLEKPAGKCWNANETLNLYHAGVEVEHMIGNNRLIAMNSPTNGLSFQKVLRHDDFSIREVDWHDRWN